MSKFKVGDVVYFITRPNQKMVVNKVEGEDITVKYYDENKKDYETHKIQQDLLNKYNESELGMSWIDESNWG